MLSLTYPAPKTPSLPEVAEGDIVEFGRPNDRRTGEIMLLTDDYEVVLDLFDGRPPVIVSLYDLPGLSVFRPDTGDTLLAA